MSRNSTIARLSIAYQKEEFGVSGSAKIICGEKFKNHPDARHHLFLADTLYPTNSVAAFSGPGTQHGSHVLAGGGLRREVPKNLNIDGNAGMKWAESIQLQMEEK